MSVLDCIRPGVSHCGNSHWARIKSRAGVHPLSFQGIMVIWADREILSLLANFDDIDGVW